MRFCKKCGRPAKGRYLLCHAHLREYKRNQEKIYRQNSAAKIKAYRANWVSTNRDRVNELGSKARKRRHRIDPLKTMLRAAKRRAAQNNIEFSITIEDIFMPLRCPLLDIPLNVNDNKLGPDSPTLDRIRNSIGYVPRNVIVVSYAANRCKGNLNSDDIMKIAMNLKFLETFRGL